MNPDDRVRTADSTIDERLRAAGNALREASAAQVDAATGLREIFHAARTVADDQAWPLADRLRKPEAPDAPLPGPPARRLLRASQRLALVVNLLLVLALSVVLVRVASHQRDLVSTTPAATTTTIVRQAQATVPASTLKTRTRVPEACLDAAELADEVISRLNRNQRDAALAAALTDYSVASQACRREAAVP